MHHSTRRHHYILAWILVFVLLSATPAMANMAPSKGVAQPDGTALPADTTPIGVSRELLIFDFFPENMRYGRYPLVTAEYTLQNPSDTGETVGVSFFSVAVSEDFTATWNGQPLALETAKLDAENYVQRVGELQLHWMSPETGRVYSIDSPKRVGVVENVFSVTVPAGGEGVLRVQYHQSDVAWDQLNAPVVHPVYHYTYLLEPAQYWAFFDELTVRVKRPRGLLLASDPRLERVNSGLLEGHFRGLPGGNLHISTRRIEIKWDLVTVLALALVYTGAALVWALWRSYRHRRSMLVTVLAVPAALVASVVLAFYLDQALSGVRLELYHVMTIILVGVGGVAYWVSRRVDDGRLT